MPTRQSISKKSIRFAVIGDNHYCDLSQRPVFDNSSLMTDIPDYMRYAKMVNTVFKPLLRKIKEIEPEFLFSTGDFVEGGMNNDPIATAEEMKNGWHLLRESGCPVMIAKGTHEGGRNSFGGKSYRKLIMPAMSKLSEYPIEQEYYRLDYQSNVFLILDYLQYKPGSKQDSWLISQLKTVADRAKHIFIFAHPPLFLWGRHYFDNPVFRERIYELCSTYPVDIYFCGHTHNQSISFHETGTDGKGFLQVAGSAVGYPAMPVTMLSDYHQIADFGKHNHYLWGIFEDSAPAFFDVEIFNSKIELRWHSLKDTATLTIPERRARPRDVKSPPFSIPSHQLEDRNQIQAAWLNIFSENIGENNSSVSFNDINLGPLPSNTSYAARHFIPLSYDALRSIDIQNQVEIIMPSSTEFAVGSISLNVLNYDGAIIKTLVASERFVCGAKWENYLNPKASISVTPSEKVTIAINFIV